MRYKMRGAAERFIAHKTRATSVLNSVLSSIKHIHVSNEVHRIGQNVY